MRFCVKVCVHVCVSMCADVHAGAHECMHASRRRTTTCAARPPPGGSTRPRCPFQCRRAACDSTCGAARPGRGRAAPPRASSRAGPRRPAPSQHAGQTRPFPRPAAARRERPRPSGNGGSSSRLHRLRPRQWWAPPRGGFCCRGCTSRASRSARRGHAACRPRDRHARRRLARRRARSGTGLRSQNIAQRARGTSPPRTTRPGGALRKPRLAAASIPRRRSARSSSAR